MIVLSGASLVLPDRMLSPATLVIDQGRIAEIRADTAGTLHNHYIVPGFIDVHIHGIEGVDVLDGSGAISAIADRLPRFGVTAFCPTTVASGPAALRAALDQVRDLRQAAAGGRARILPAHLESNFINPEYRGAQPAACLRSPRAASGRPDLQGPAYVGGDAVRGNDVRGEQVRRADPLGPPNDFTAVGRPNDFTASDILDEIERAAADVGIVTLAPELDGGLDLIGWLTARGHRVSLGHSGATYEQGEAAIAAGARHATHLFNRMPPFAHRDPGLVGAILQAEDVVAELICDGVHLHPAVIRTAIAAKQPSRVLAITDGTAASGLPAGARAALGGQAITARESAAFLDDGTLAGSIATMDRVFRLLVGRVGLSLVDAATLCATTPARALGLLGHGLLTVDAVADLVVLDDQLAVVQTYVGGELVYSRA